MAGMLKIVRNRCLLSVRTFGRSTARFEKPAPSTIDAEAHAGKLSGKTHRVNNLEKRFLVWAGKYKSVHEIPALVSPESVEKARNKVRIRIANYMMLATAMACLVMVVSGKRAADKGESVQKANIEWHKRVNEDAMRNQK